MAVKLLVPLLCCLLSLAQGESMRSRSDVRRSRESRMMLSWQPSCRFEAAKDLNATAFYVRQDRTRFFYPEPTGSLYVGPGLPGLRILCPGGKITLEANVSTLAAAVAECVYGTTVNLFANYQPLSSFGCSGTSQPVVQLTVKTTNIGERIAEIGYRLGLIDFLPVVDELAVSEFRGGYLPRWARFKALGLKVGAADVNATNHAAMVPGQLAARVPFDDVYDVEQQKAEFMGLFRDKALVDKYLSRGGFVAAKLVSPVDLFYEAQRTGTHFYENTVPVWRSVAEGNWDLVSEAVRGIGADALSGDVDVWSGEYLSLYLPNALNETTYVELPHGLKPAQFLFKVVFDRSNKRGLVFLTLNNPHLVQPTKKDIICEPLPSCQAQFPLFSDSSRGYTYCCSLGDFQTHAQELGLPALEEF